MGIISSFITRAVLENARKAKVAEGQVAPAESDKAAESQEWQH